MKKIFLLIPVLALAMAAQAQVTASNELKTLIGQSFGYFPKVKETENAVVTAQEKLTLTELNKYPEVTADASYAYVRPKIEIPLNGENFQFAPVHNVSGAVNANYLLFDFGRLKANVNRSKDDLLYARHNVENVKAQLAYQVSNVYYNIVYLQKAIGIQDSVLRFLNENKTIVESQLRNGTALRIDLLNIQASIDNEQNRKIDLQNSLQKQLNLLEYTTGSKQTAHAGSFDFDISLTDPGAALGAAQQNNYDFILAKDRIKQAESDLAITRISEKPTIGLKGSAGIKNGYVPYIADMRFNYMAGVGLSIPIYNGGKNRQQQKLQQNIIRQNELAVETLAGTYKKDIEQALTDIGSSLERIRNTRGQIEQAQAAQGLASTRFKGGTGTNLEITNASTNVQRALLTKLQYEYQLCIAKLELTKLMGYPYWQ
ncbi:TolC family protein [Sediminibacterium soli]|uniref:TolC family protein n=1 Tax=Sediminibacterium soli TaxID=2698829 RepID=UPI0013798801|nr:TolC family protein [Sediminibacterium soli]NCI46985.1 TolC family protein [Sediminibacterium soli]